MITYPHAEGQPVTYHGSLAELHGLPLYAWICSCDRAHAVEQPRFMLTDWTGQPVAWHVRPTSINPAPTPEEP